MLKRTLAALILVLLPWGALADEATPASDPAAPPSPEATAAPAGDSTATSAGLGPQSAGGSAGGSNADAAALQPAGLSPIQSSAADSAGLTAPANALQAPAATSDQLKVLASEADGAPQGLDSGTDDPWWPWVGTAASLAVLAALGILWRDRRRFS